MVVNSSRDHCCAILRNRSIAKVRKYEGPFILVSSLFFWESVRSEKYQLILLLLPEDFVASQVIMEYIP